MPLGKNEIAKWTKQGAKVQIYGYHHMELIEQMRSDERVSSLSLTISENKTKGSEAT